jgi:hypothetical protein
MSTTITLANSIAFAQAFAGFKSLNIGNSNEPAITAGNIVLQTVLGPPFAWNWNRTSSASLITTVTGQQDYPVSASSFGWLEKADYRIPTASITNTQLASGTATYTAANKFQAGDQVTVTGTTNGSGIFNVTNATIVTASSSQFTLNINSSNVVSAGDTGTATVGTTTEITQIVNVLGSGTELGAPVNIAPQLDDNAGNITFRLLPIPGRVYTVGTIWQNRIPALMTSLSSTWAPIPDHYSFIYQAGFTALMLAYTHDPKWQQFNQQFIARLLSTSEGWNADQRNVFLNTWIMQTEQMQAQNLVTMQGAQARGGM